MLSEQAITAESDWAIDHLIKRSARNSGARLPAAFATKAPSPPLAGLIQGGRGGDVRLKLYLSMVLLAGTNHVHKEHGRNKIVDVSSVTWAEALALSDPRRAGARRVADAQQQLSDRKLIRVERVAGRPPQVQLLHASGSKEPWAEPGTPYIRVPLDIWTSRWIWYLTAAQLAVYIALLDLCGSSDNAKERQPQVLSGTHHEHYGMSEDTWRRSSAALQEYGLIETDFDAVRIGLGTKRRRKTYKIAVDGLSNMAPVSARA